jgi:hypothetical protein
MKSSPQISGKTAVYVCDMNVCMCVCVCVCVCVHTHLCVCVCDNHQPWMWLVFPQCLAPSRSRTQKENTGHEVTYLAL